MSAKQLERMLGVTYKTAWFMAHRIREAMKSDKSAACSVVAPAASWKPTKPIGARRPTRTTSRSPLTRGGFRHKMMIVSLVERDGEKRSFHVPKVNGCHSECRPQVTGQPASAPHDGRRQVLPQGRQAVRFAPVGDHGAKEYARGNVTTNTVESSFAILKRGLIGTFHSVSEKHLQRYCNEFDFRWNTRVSQGFSDSMRAEVALKGIGGKRLTYRRIGGQQEASA
jgi:hypothetical protein